MLESQAGVGTATAALEQPHTDACALHNAPWALLPALLPTTVWAILTANQQHMLPANQQPHGACPNQKQLCPWISHTQSCERQSAAIWWLP
jgi:hypothetical protein